MPLNATTPCADAFRHNARGAFSVSVCRAAVALLWLVTGCGSAGTEQPQGTGGMSSTGSGGSVPGNNGTGGSGVGSGGSSSGGSGMGSGGTGGGGGMGSGGATAGTGGAVVSGGTTGGGSGGNSTSSGGVQGSGGSSGRGGAAGTGGRPGNGGGAAGGTAGQGAAPAGGHGGQAATGGAAGGASGMGGNTVATTCNKSGPATAQTPTIWVIGDSTASLYDASLYPRMGWAQPAPGYYAPACATVQDKALSGRSSKSFWDEGAWTPIRTALKSGDFVLIQFGHNDEKDDMPSLYTNPATTYKEYLTRYIDETKAKGATPILLTSIARNNWSGGKLTDTHGAYPPAVRELAAAKNVALVDATALTMDYLEQIGQTAANKVYLNLAPGEFPNYPNGNSDNTHLQESGANKFLRLILADMYRQKLLPGLLLKAVPQAP